MPDGFSAEPIVKVSETKPLTDKIVSMKVEESFAKADLTIEAKKSVTA